MYSDADTREAEIKKLAAVYDNLRNDILPLLRRSEITFEYKGKLKTDNDFKTLLGSSAGSLNESEMIYAASISSDKVSSYTTYTSKYPADWRGWNNLASAQAKQGKLSDAKVSLQKVLAKSNDNAAALNNLGVLSLADGDLNAAWDYFVRAENAGCKSPSLAYNKGVISVKRGNYLEAVDYFKAESFNKALAQTLAGDNDIAITTLEGLGSSEYGLFYYLKAVTSARAGKVGDVVENLRMAISKESKLKAYAKADAEFKKFIDNSAFRGVIE